MTTDPHLPLAIDAMVRFARRTGIGEPPAAARRYLWTDAFAVGNFLSLHGAVGEPRYRALALQLVADVHHVLGRHRPDDGRTGWISGLGEADGEAHPTAGGLRIGKALPERAPGEAADERAEWEQDGQYFHYLTKWMDALDQMARATGEVRYAAWARELMAVAHRRFVYPAAHGGRRMYWKMSIDLTRPLVASMGHHDPLDGLVTCLQLAATAKALGVDAGELAPARADFAAMVDHAGLATGDPLGIGGLLLDAGRLDRLGGHDDLRDDLLTAAAVGLRHWLSSGDLHLPARLRLAFRELGLAIGLAAVDAMGAAPVPPPAVAALRRYRPVRDAIVDFWLQPEHRHVDPWHQHEDINEVMLATSLLGRPQCV